MNWKLTVALLAALAVLLGVYLFTDAPGSGTDSGEPRLLAGYTAERLVRIQIARRGEPELSLERGNDAVGPHWRVKGPADHPADADAVQQMLFAMDRFRKTGAMDPGRPETAPALTGLGDPRLVVRLHVPDGAATLRFGNSPPTNTGAVFFQKDDDPKIYLVGTDTLEVYDKPLSAIRSKQLVRYAPYQVVRLELEHKFVVARKGQPPAVEYEKSLFERFEQGPERGWYMTRPHKEKVDDLKVQRLAADLAGLAVDEVRPAGDPKAQGFDEPQVRIALTLHGIEKPVTVHFGGPAEGGKKRYVQVPGTGEVALLEMRKFDQLPVQRKHLRSSAVFPFPKDAVKTFTVEARGLGKVRIERKLVRKGNEPVEAPSWEVAEPQGVRIEKDKVEVFVADILIQQITDFLGAQDPKLAGLDPPAATVTVETRDGRTHVLYFGLTTEGYFRREGVDEIFQVKPQMVRRLKDLELNFLHREIFNVPRASLREFAFESKGLPPVYYRLKLDAEGKKWAFVDPGNARSPVDEDKVSELLAGLNYIEAQGGTFVGKGPEAAAKYRLDERDAPATLTIVYRLDEKEPVRQAVVFLSENQSDRELNPVFYARLKDSPFIFQIKPAFVVSLRKPPVKKE